MVEKYNMHPPNSHSLNCDFTSAPKPIYYPSAMIRALELFCGIGGFAAAAADCNIRIVGAIDQSPLALESYRLNFPDHPCRKADLERIGSWELTAAAADLWWLSPPCQPYCERGARRDIDDPRSKSLLHILELLERMPGDRLPSHLALENVEGFTRSQARDMLLQTLQHRGFHLRERMICPTALGVPSRRPRYYLAASRSVLTGTEPQPSATMRTLSHYLETDAAHDPPSSLQLPADVVARFGKGLRILDPADPLACTTCFTSGYGRSIVNAGSYLACGTGVRYFMPEEIVRLLHFPPGFRFPPGMPLRNRWRLAGNSLSVIAVRELLRSFPEIRATTRTAP